MLTQVLDDLIRKQKPYYAPIEPPIKGLNNQYWIVFKYKRYSEADNLINTIASFLRLRDKPSSHKILRIDLNTADVYEYIPKSDNNIPSATLIRTRNSEAIESFLNRINLASEPALVANSFLEIKSRRRRRFNLPKDSAVYENFLGEYLERTRIYRRSTAYFSSTILKNYADSLKTFIQNEGEIRLLMDWQGFTNRADVEELQKLYDRQYREDFIKRTLEYFLQQLEEGEFTSTQMLAELVSLNILKIKLVKMLNSGAIYHKKTGIMTDCLGNSLLHEGSDNFTRSAHSTNAESITFLYWDDSLDENAIADSIAEFDEDWFNSPLTFDLSAEFLEQTLREIRRRLEAKQPIIEEITPRELTAGETLTVTIKGSRLNNVREVSIFDNPLIKFSIKQAHTKKLILQANISPEHPPQTIPQIQLGTDERTYSPYLSPPLEIVQPLTLPDFSEIGGFQEAIARILEGNYGTPEDFLYYLAQQKPHLWQNLQTSAFLDSFVDSGILFEHQKSGAQHCQRVLKQFGVAVCADSVGLGKTRLGAAVGKLFREENGQAKIAIVAAKKLHENWRREMAELGFRNRDYELYNKNLMSRTGNSFLDDFNRYGGPDLVLIDEAHEGIRNHSSRIHKTCLQIRAQDRENQRERHFLLLTATPWNNRREDIYNILSPFLTRPAGFRELDFPPELENWFNNRDIGVESFTDDNKIFRRVYRELFLQRTRKMLQNAAPDLNLYAKRQAVWLPVNFETNTEQALDQIFTEFESKLYIPSADPIRYLKGSTEQRSLLANQRRFFLQRAESSM